MGPKAALRTVQLGGPVTVLAMVAALIPFGIATAEAADAPLPQARVDVATAPAAEEVADWRDPQPSADASPTEVVEGALKEDGKKPTSTLRIVSVIKKDGKPVIKTETAQGSLAAKKVVSKAQADPRLLSVEVDSQSMRVLGEETDAGTAAKAPTSEALATNDPYWSQMWGLTRLQAETAWAVTRGNPAVKVAVVDTGVSTHVDLPEAQISAGKDFSGEGGANGRSDGHGHGTHVTGTMIASVNNSVGVAGLAPDVSILPVKVLNSSGSGSDSSVAQGILYAANQGADVISMSLGGGYSSTIATAVAYAIAQGSLPVAAAGNSRTSGSPVSYPAALPGVLAVAATNSNDTYASFSNAGSYVDISAPGVGIWSTLPGNTYASWGGTSMATPHVSAVAALVMSRAAELGVIGVSVDLLLTSTADDLGPAGWDSDYGAGLVDPVVALAAVASPPESAPSAPTGVTISNVTAQSATVSWTAASGPISRQFTVVGTPGSVSCGSLGSATSCNLTHLTAQTQYSVSVVARNLGGSSSSSTSATFTTLTRQDLGSDSFLTPTPIAAGSPVNDVIDSADDLDHYIFTSPANGTVRVTLTNLPQDYDLYLYDTTGAVKGYSWNWSTFDEVVSLTLPAGQYIAQVRPYGNSGSESPYRLLATVPAVPTPPPTPPAPPTTINRTVKVGAATFLSTSSGGRVLRWVNLTPAKCIRNGNKVRGKRVGTCKLSAYAVGAPQLGVRVKAVVKVVRR